jgi:DNA-binding transcriptional MerR regulator
MLNIPNKSHFKMNEVCGLTGVKPYVLRFWETEFPEIEATMSASGQKLYEHKDIEAIAIIKKMLFDDKLNIEQAKAEIAMRLTPTPPMPSSDESTCLTDAALTTREVSRMELSESDIKGLEAAKMHLRQMLNVTDDLKQRHEWQ